MLRDRISLYRDRTRRLLTQAFQGDHSPHQIAASFAVGIFLTALPNGGASIPVVFAIGYLSSWINTPAIVSSIAVMNPLVKPAVYAASLQVGAVVTGSSVIPEGSSLPELAAAGLKQLLIGNLLVAIVLSLAGYLLVRYLTRVHRRRTSSDRPATESSIAIALFGWR